jgi:hypothetical protein
MRGNYIILTCGRIVSKVLSRQMLLDVDFRTGERVSLDIVCDEIGRNVRGSTGRSGSASERGGAIRPCLFPGVMNWKEGRGCIQLQ